MELVKNRIVVKVGTASLTTEKGAINFRTMDKLAQVLSSLSNEGYEIILVSSGAIAVGANKMRLQQKPQDLKLKQAAASVGQCELMHLYDKFFSEYGKMVSQILLSGDDVEHREKKQNLRNTFFTLLEHNIIPIVNENDSISSKEIESDKKIFGDNDTLSAIVAVLTKASRLILLSDIEGLYDEDPHSNPNASIIHRVDSINDDIRAIATGSGSNRGTGGMVSKLDAAEIVTSKGIDMNIAHGFRPENIFDILENKNIGTLFIGQR